MNDAVRVPTDGLLTAADLASRPDFTLGLAAVSPSTRTIAGPGGATVVEPRVMQVLVVLAGSVGQVVTRETLFQRCWGGVYVGDDSLNRAVGAVRKLATDIAGGSFEIETIPRTGYRLTGERKDPLAGHAGSEQEPAHRTFSRRDLAGAATGIVALGAVAGWTLLYPDSSRRFDTLMASGRDGLQKGKLDKATAQQFEEAVRLRPDSAPAWGSLALIRSLIAQGAATHSLAGVEPAGDAARRALQLDPNEPNALLAMFELQGSTLDWLARDRILRRIVAIDSTNVIALTELVALLQAAGLNRESWRWNEHALTIEPLSSDLLCRRAMKLWIARRYSDADKVIDQVRDLYPNDQFSWWVRFMILALTGRAAAASALFNAQPGMLGPPPMQQLWRSSLPALESPSPQAIAKARDASVEAAEQAGILAAHAVMILSALNQVDSAFEIATGFLLWRGKVVLRRPADMSGTGPDASWRIGVQWLFTPPCAVMRADPRFMPLCDGIGLTQYWRGRGVRPDYLSTDG